MSKNKKTIWQKDKDHFIHPWTDFSAFKDEGSLVLTDASGICLTDSEGKQYIDGIGGLWCINIGYGREEMADAIATQANRIPYFSTFGHHTTPLLLLWLQN